MTIALSHKQELWIVTITVEPELAASLAEQLDGNAVAISVLAPPRQKTATLEAMYDHEPALPQLTAQCAVIAALMELPAPRIDCRRAPPLDWLKKVAEDFPPFRIAAWTIYGAQHCHAVPDKRQGLQIDATSAFGTGEHPSTRGCLLMLAQILKRHRRLKHMLDIGCGSGILAMGFAKATHGMAVAIDLDPLSVMIARHNRAANGLRRRIKLSLGDGYHAALVKRHAPYDLIMANIFARPLALMAKDLKRRLRPGGIAILAGLLNMQANMVINAHRAQGLHPIAKMRIGEWTILALQRRGEA